MIRVGYAEPRYSCAREQMGEQWAASPSRRSYSTPGTSFSLVFAPAGHVCVGAEVPMLLCAPAVDLEMQAECRGRAQPGGRVEVMSDHNFGLLKRLKGGRDGTWRVEGKFPQERLKIEVLAPPAHLHPKIDLLTCRSYQQCSLKLHLAKCCRLLALVPREADKKVHAADAGRHHAPRYRVCIRPYALCRIKCFFTMSTNLHRRSSNITNWPTTLMEVVLK
jgi:hypothetical protein